MDYKRYLIGFKMNNCRYSRKIISIITISLVFILSACSSMNQDEQPNETEPITPLEIEETTVSASGEVVPTLKSELSFQNNAKNLQIKVNAGDVVNEGDVLVECDDLQQIADVESAEARLADAESEYDVLKRNFANKIDQDAAIANIEAAASALELARKNLELTKLIAPFSGTVIEVYANSFEDINANQPVILLADMQTLVVETTDLNEIDVNKISVGNVAEISFDAFPDIRVEGEVSDIDLKSAVGSGVNYTVTIQPKQKVENLRWGMSAFIVIDLDK